MKKVRWVAWLAVLAGASGCTPTPRADALRIQLWGEPVSLDPSLAEDLLSFQLLVNTSEGLMGYDGAGVLEHRLAESHEISPDGLKLVFTMRKNAAWSDGMPITAEQVVAGM